MGWRDDIEERVAKLEVVQGYHGIGRTTEDRMKTCILCHSRAWSSTVEEFSFTRWYIMIGSTDNRVPFGARVYAHASCLKEHGFERCSCGKGWQKREEPTLTPSRCATCAYFVPKGERSGDVFTSSAICARFPPNYGAWWAMVREDDWCGEYKNE